MSGALRATFPRLRWRPGERYPLVPPEVRADADVLAAELDLLDRELIPDFHQFDEAALAAQNTFRLGQVIVILGGAAATALGAVQAALGGGVIEIAIAEALVAGVLTGTVAFLRGRRAQEDYFTSRLKAERLRSEYFVFLGRVAPYDLPDPEQRLARLRQRVAELAAEELA